MAFSLGGPRAAFPQKKSPLISQDLLVALDSREVYGPDLDALESALRGNDPFGVRLAIRGLSRRHSPRFIGMIATFLSDARDSVASEAAFALGQMGQDSLYTAQAAHAILDGVPSMVPGAIGAAARSLGRFPLRDSAGSRQVGRQLLHWLGDSLPLTTLVDVVRGIEAYLRLATPTGAPDPAMVARLESLSLERADDHSEDRLRVRRAAATALARSVPPDSATLAALARDDDWEIRRQAMRWAAAAPASYRAAVITSGLGHSAPIVRIEAIKSWSKARELRCSLLRDLIDDSVPSVALEALDALRADCSKDQGILKRLQALAVLDSTAPFGRPTWHRPAHALVALARIDAASAKALIRAAPPSPIWQMRLYRAYAATAARETNTLRALAADSNYNVQEAAVAGLIKLQGHGADSILVAALATSDYQLMRTAAIGLRGSPRRGAIAPRAFSALQRVTRDRSETSRDTRLALLDLIEEFGDATWAWRLGTYARDFDPVIAARAAAIVSKGTGTPSTAAPARLQPIPLSAATLDSLVGARLLVTLSPESGGGRFEISLFPAVAPATVLRVVSHARSGYYRGLTFHRVLPNFVIQGGSPAANEYTGDPRFLRDEIGFVSQERGTVGLSTRGLDTGDAQFYVNLVDNIRLDFDYTLWGKVTQGMEVVDGILEGDVIDHVEVITRSK